MRQGLAVGNIEVAKCKACAYELEWKAVERDLNNEGKSVVSFQRSRAEQVWGLSGTVCC